MNEKNMFYEHYNYGSFTPINQIPTPNIPNNYINGQFNDLTERISRLERQLKRLDQRLTHLETPYANKNINGEPDNNMYIM